MSGLKFRGLRRADRGTQLGDAEDILLKGETGFLGVTGDSGYPYVVPLNFVYDAPTRRIYFHSALEGHKLDAIETDDRVCFAVVEKARVLPDVISTAYESAIVFGRANIVTGSEKEYALQRLLDKYVLGKSKVTAEEASRYIEKNIGNTAVVRIDIEHVSGKKREG
ncbi:MAG: pyridoxamine 5'-phosphate oxidase family protein [Bacillota bacterium]